LVSCGMFSFHTAKEGRIVISQESALSAMKSINKDEVQRIDIMLRC